MVLEDSNFPLPQIFRQCRHLAVEQLLGLLPHPRCLAVLERQEARQKGLAESFACLSWEKAGQMIYRDDRKRRVVISRHGQRRVRERAILRVNRDRVVRVGGVARDVADDGELALGRGERLLVKERRDRLGQVDAVDEDVGLDDFAERAALGRLRHVPLDDLLVWDAGLLAQVDRTSAAAAEGPDDKDRRLAPGYLLAIGQLSPDVVEQKVLVGVAGHPWHSFRRGVLQLMRPRLDGQSSTGIACMVSKGCDTPTGIVLKKLQVQQGPAASRESRKNFLPASLVLVTVRKLDMGVLERDLL